MSVRTAHDCAKDRCDTDTRTAAEVEVEGYDHWWEGARYRDCPYGHTHPDVRFNQWVRGWTRAATEAGALFYCDEPDEYCDPCEGHPKSRAGVMP